MPLRGLCCLFSPAPSPFPGTEFTTSPSGQAHPQHQHHSCSVHKMPALISYHAKQTGKVLLSKTAEEQHRPCVTPERQRRLGAFPWLTAYVTYKRKNNLGKILPRRKKSSKSHLTLKNQVSFSSGGGAREGWFRQSQERGDAKAYRTLTAHCPQFPASGLPLLHNHPSPFTSPLHSSPPSMPCPLQSSIHTVYLPLENT